MQRALSPHRRSKSALFVFGGDFMVDHIKQHRVVPIDTLAPHPRNYRKHPDDELAHIMESIRLHGFYRNIVLAKDRKTILAGHGVVEAARRLGYKEIPAICLDYAPDDPHALKVLVSDNEISHLAESDDRALTELLRDVANADDLLGTGYDEMMLANLVMVTRPESEIEDLDAAAQWVGMPEYEEGEEKIQIIINFANEQDCQDFCESTGIGKGKEAVKGARKSFWWPPRDQDDVSSLMFTSGKTTA